MRTIEGIAMDSPIHYQLASLRFFEKNEHLIAHVSPDNVLILVYEGILRFTEDKIPREIHAGQYYIQRSTHLISGENVSESPKFLYVLFQAEWSSEGNILPPFGTFSYPSLAPLIHELDTIAHGDFTFTERSCVFLRLLSVLYRSVNTDDTPAKKIKTYMEQNAVSITSLDEICTVFHYSKNHVINIFKEEYGITPFHYIHEVKLQRAMYLLRVTAKSIDEIAHESGFNHYSHFYRLFIRKHGISPQEWRSKLKRTP